MDEAARAPYVKLAEADKARSLRQKEEIKTLGYYTLENGTKSTDPENHHLLKVKKKRAKRTKKTEETDGDGAESDREESKESAEEKPAKQRKQSKSVGCAKK